MDYHMQFMEFLSLFRKRGQSYAVYEISLPSSRTWTIICNLRNFFPSPKMWTIICNLRNFFPFSKNVDYHMQYKKFLSLLQKHGLSFAIYEISFSSSKTWTIICNLWNFFPFSKNMTIICYLWNFFLFFKNVDYHMLFLEFLSLQKHGLS